MYTRKTFFLTAISLLVGTLFYRYGYTKSLDQKVIVQQIMAHPMPEIIKRCQKDHNYSDQDMIILEKELKRFLALTLINDETSSGIGMYSADVDNLWHTFILFTKEYAAFCNQYFKHFVHHVPEIEKASTPERIEEMHTDFQAFVKNYEELFGEEVHPIWFLDMSDATDVDTSTVTS